MKTGEKVEANKVLRLHPNDNTIVALANLTRGEEVFLDREHYVLREDISAKHKFVTCDLKIGDKVVMYGLVVGKALKRINQGTALTTENTVHEVEPYNVHSVPYAWTAPAVERWKTCTFEGYFRSDGQVGTRNYWIVFPLVFCENRNINAMKVALQSRLGYAPPEQYSDLVESLLKQKQDYKFSGPIEYTNYSPNNDRAFRNIDGIKFLTHEGGCGGTREDATNLCRLLAGYINNPNVAGATVLSLGCQHAQVELLKNQLAQVNRKIDKPILYFEQQQFLSEDALLRKAISDTFHCLEKVNNTKRKAASLNKLVVGLKCGGSDGFSGITANPAMGHLSDIIAALGGKTILAEFPELCGAEQNLIDRCGDPGLAQKFLRLMTEYQEKARAIGAGFHMNPSPGNIKDGLITDAMKSAGAALKGGMSPVRGVLNYGEYIANDGLNLLCTPGNDVESTTGMAGSGANLIIFSTGLGTPTGNAITPVIKTSTNSLLPQRMADIIDFDHGDIISKGKSIQQSAEELLECIIEIASGKLCKAEKLFQDDFIPWKKGVSL